MSVWKTTMEWLGLKKIDPVEGFARGEYSAGLMHCSTCGASVAPDQRGRHKTWHASLGR